MNRKSIVKYILYIHFVKSNKLLTRIYIMIEVFQFFFATNNEINMCEQKEGLYS